MTAKMKTPVSPTKLSGLSTVLVVTMWLSGCGRPAEPSFWDAEGSWRAVEAVSASEAWFASSNGEWLRVTLEAEKTKRTVFGGPVPDPTDSAVGTHFRGLALVDGALVGTAVGSPAMIRRGELDAEGAVTGRRATVWQEDDSLAFLDAVIALDDTTLVAMGDPIDGCLCVVRSEDGGESWAKVPCAVKDGPGVPASREGEAAFAASNGNLSCAGDTVWMLSGGGASRVYRSLDRGQSWTVFDTPLQQGGQMTGGFSMDFADAHHGIVWGGNWEAKDDNTARAAVTSDGGETWALLADGVGPGYGSSVCYRPGSAGQQLVLVGTPGGVDVSDDGGTTWRHVSDSGFYAARFSPDGAALWVCGNGQLGRYPTAALGW